MIFREAAQNWRRRALTVLIIFAVAASAWQIREIVLDTQHNTTQVHNLTRSLQSAVIESCEENGNARAAAIREGFHEEIEETKHPDPQMFNALVKAGVSAEALRAAADRKVVRLEERRSKVKITDCKSQYRISPGSGNRRRDQR